MKKKVTKKTKFKVSVQLKDYNGYTAGYIVSRDINGETYWWAVPNSIDKFISKNLTQRMENEGKAFDVLITKTGKGKDIKYSAKILKEKK